MKASASPPPPRPILHWRQFLRSKGLVPSPHLVEILSEYGYRVEPVGGNAGLPG
jgi:hypothetical protein